MEKDGSSLLGCFWDVLTLQGNLNIFTVYMIQSLHISFQKSNIFIFKNQPSKWIVFNIKEKIQPLLIEDPTEVINLMKNKRLLRNYMNCSELDELECTSGCMCLEMPNYKLWQVQT